MSDVDTVRLIEDAQDLISLSAPPHSIRLQAAYMMIERLLAALGRLAHRGAAVSADAETIREALGVPPEGHHHGCDSRSGGECDCYMRKYTPALAALDRLAAAEADNARWLAWSSGSYPDDSPGDVIAGETDGTIVLDDAITTWNPLRALAFFADRLAAAEAQRDALVAELAKLRAEREMGATPHKCLNAECGTIAYGVGYDACPGCGDTTGRAAVAAITPTERSCPQFASHDPHTWEQGHCPGVAAITPTEPKETDGD